MVELGNCISTHVPSNEEDFVARKSNTLFINVNNVRLRKI